MSASHAPTPSSDPMNLRDLDDFPPVDALVITPFLVLVLLDQLARALLTFHPAYLAWFLLTALIGGAYLFRVFTWLTRR